MNCRLALSAYQGCQLAALVNFQALSALLLQPFKAEDAQQWPEQWLAR